MKLSKKKDKHEQYSRRNCVLVHKIVETDDEMSDDLVIETISTKINIEVSPADLDRTHRIWKKNAGQNKPRPIIMKRSRYNVRKKISPNNKKTETVQCKCKGKFNTKAHGNSKEGKVRKWIHKRVDL